MFSGRTRKRNSAPNIALSVELLRWDKEERPNFHQMLQGITTEAESLALYFILTHFNERCNYCIYTLRVWPPLPKSFTLLYNVQINFRRRSTAFNTATQVYITILDWELQQKHLQVSSRLATSDVRRQTYRRSNEHISQGMETWEQKINNEFTPSVTLFGNSEVSKLLRHCVEVKRMHGQMPGCTK